MVGLPEIAARTLRSLFGGTPATAQPVVGPLATVTPLQAVLAVEALVADTVAHAGLLAGATAGLQPLLRAAPGPQSAAAASLGEALTGRRTAVALPLEDLGVIAAVLADASRWHAPWLVYVRAPDLDPADGALTATVATGAVVLVANGAQEAVDLALVGRRVAEQALLPVVVVLAGADTAVEVRLPEPQVVEALLGRADDLVEAPTPGQAVLDGPQRRRLPARFDADRAAALGLALQGPDRQAAAAANDLYFADAVPSLLLAAVADWRRLCGRTVTPVSPLPARRRANASAAAPMRPSVFPKREILRQAVARAWPQAAAPSTGPSTEPRPPTAVAGEATDVPLVVRRLARDTGGADSVVRFWGEVAQPRRAGEGMAELDPWLAAGYLPPATAGLSDRSTGRAQVPQIDLAACTACGRCWTACPDAALAPALLPTEALLDAAADRAAGPGRNPAADKLRRAHRQWAGRIDGQLAASGERTLGAPTAQAALAWLLDKLGAADAERQALQAAGEATLAELERLPAAATPLLHHGPHGRDKGSGRLLVLAVDPRTCQGCDACVAACPEQAIALGEQAAAMVPALRATWRAWEQAPDTAGATVAQAAALPEIGPMAALLLSRHAQQALVAGDHATAGSGPRLAARLVAAVAEQQGQARLVQTAAALQQTVGKLRDAVQAALAAATPVDDLAVIDSALSGVGTRPGNLAQVLDNLQAAGVRSTLDPRKVQRLAAAAQELEALRQRLLEGAHGAGRARYGVVVAGQTAAAWAGRFPRNPFAAPVVVDASGRALDLALGLATGLRDQALAEARTVRRAALALEAPADFASRDAALLDLAWADLTPDERANCPPVLVLADPATLAAEGLAGLHRVLASDLSVHVLVVDGHAPGSAGPDLPLLALGARQAFVLSTSIGAPDHLYAGVAAALRHAGPALLHVCAPDAARDGIRPADVVPRARLAVDCRLQPLLRYDPGAEGVFGSRLSLAGNPAPEAAWALDAQGQPCTPAAWYGPDVDAAWLARTVEACRTRWATLQELAGVVTPFTEPVRARLERELQAGHAAQIAELQARHAVALAELEAATRADHARRLRDRLLQLAAAAPPRTASPAPDVAGRPS